MAIRDLINQQFEKPSGGLGKLVGWLMSISNRKKNEWLISKINPQPGERLLEIGYGNGDVIEVLAGTLYNSFIAGIDHSSLMYQQAIRNNKRYIRTKRVALHLGTVWELDYPQKSFDVIYGSNVHFFWKNPEKEFGLLRGLLKPGGRLLMVFQPRWIKSPDELRRFAEKTLREYYLAGFQQVELDYMPMRPVTCVALTGHNPWGNG